MTAVPADRRCTAPSRHTGERCGNWAIRGARVCRIHGGSLKRTKAAAQRRLAEAKAAESLAKQGVAPLGNPLEAFRDLAAEAVALKDFFAAGVAELRNDLTNVDRQGREEVRAKVAAYERGMDRAGRLLGEYVRLGIDARLAELDERQGLLVEQVLMRVVAALGHDPSSPLVREVAARELLAAAPRVVEVTAE